MKTLISYWTMFKALINSVPERLRASPLRLYKSLIRKRDWLLAKINYLNEESAKWRTLFRVARSPYSLLRAMGFSPQMAIGVLTVGSVGAGGVVANEVLDGPSFQRGDSGVYEAPYDAPVFYSKDNQTLLLNLGTTPVGTVSMSNVTVNAFTGSTLPAGQTDVVFVGGLPAGAGFTETFLKIGHLTIDRWRCDQLKLDNIEAYQLNIKWNASDGQSISAVAGVPRNRAVNGGNRADDNLTAGGTYDQIRIEAGTSGVNGRADVMTLSNLLTSGGDCHLSRIKAGTIDILLNEIGPSPSDGFAIKDFVVSSTVVYKNFTNIDNVEEVSQ